MLLVAHGVRRWVARTVRGRLAQGRAGERHPHCPLPRVDAEKDSKMQRFMGENIHVTH